MFNKLCVSYLSALDAGIYYVRPKHGFKVNGCLNIPILGSIGLCLGHYIKKLLVSYQKLKANQLGSDAFITGPNRCRDVEETLKKTSDRFPGRNTATPKKL